MDFRSLTRRHASRPRASARAEGVRQTRTRPARVRREEDGHGAGLHAWRRIAAQPRCWQNEPKGHFGKTKPRGLKNHPAAVGNERRLPASVSGLLLQWMAQ